MKKKKYLLLSFFIPFITYIFVFYINELFTNKIMIMGDSQVQYYPLFHYLKGIFNGENSIFYSFYKCLGGSMFGTFFYYLSSPLNIFLIFVDKTKILDFMTILTIIKLSLCGLTMHIFLSNKFKKNSLITLSFSLCYAFMGFNLNYFLNIMWIDVIFLCPIVILGLDNILNDKSPILYIVSLTISIISNYYMAYMLCIFCILYFIYEILLKYNFKTDKETIYKYLKKFIVPSLLSGLMCTFFIIPSLYESMSYGRSNSLKKIFVFDYNIFNLIAKTYLGTIDGYKPFNTAAINIYCGIITIPLVYLYLVNKNVLKKEKVLIIFILLMFILPNFIGPLNYIWHVFTLPVGYYFRYAYLLNFFLLFIAFKSFNNIQINKLNILNYLAVYLSYTVIVIFINYFKNYYNYLNYYYIWITCILLIIYFIILLKLTNKNALKKIIFVLILFELIFNCFISIKQYEFNDKTYINSQNEIFDIIDKYQMDYRINDYKMINNSFIKNYFSTNSFLSTFQTSIYNKFYELSNYTIDDSINIFFHVNYSYIYDSIFSIKYSFQDYEDPYYNLINQDTIFEKNTYVYENPNVLGIGYIVKNKCNNIEVKQFYDQEIFNCLTNNTDTYYKEFNNTSNEKNIYKYIINKPYYYVYIPNNDYINIVKEKLNDIIYISNNYIIAKNDIINFNLELELTEDIEIKVYYFDYELFKNKFDEYIKETMNYKIINNKLIGNINTDGGILLITIPYENGINVYVDNILTDYDKSIDKFIAVNLEEGYHEIKIEYVQPLFKKSLYVSILSLFISLIYIKKQISFLRKSAGK